MANENLSSPFSKDLSIQTEMENIWSDTCGSWQNCNESTIQSFLTKCEELSIDSQYCMSWVEQYKDQIPNWNDVSKVSLKWINQHTSAGSPYSVSDENLS